MGDHRRESERRDDRAWKRHREDPLACHNCGERGHLAKDCLSTHGKEIKDKVLVKDRRMKPRVIGTGGGVIKGLEQELGVRLKVEDVVREDPDQGFYVRISGPGLDEVCRAVTRVEKLVAEVDAEQRQFEERRAQYQTQMAAQSALQEQTIMTSPGAAQPLGVALNAALQGATGGQGMQQSRPGGFAGRPGFGGGSAVRPGGMTSARDQYGVTMNQNGLSNFVSSGGTQAQGGYDGGTGSFTQGADVNQGVDAFQARASIVGATMNAGFVPEQGSIYNQGGVVYQPGNVNRGVVGNQVTKQSAGVHSNQRLEYDQGGTPLEQNMEMSPDRKDATNSGRPSYPAMDFHQVGSAGVQGVGGAYSAAAYGSGALNGPGGLGEGIPGGSYGAVQGGGNSTGVMGTLDELETRNIAQYLELAKQQMFEEDEEINRHRTRMREIQDYFQLRLSTLRQKQSQQREEFLILESQQRPQHHPQDYHLAKAPAGNGPASFQQLEAGNSQANVGASAQYGLESAYASVNPGFGGAGKDGTQGYGDTTGQQLGAGSGSCVGQTGTGGLLIQGQQYASYG